MQRHYLGVAYQVPTLSPNFYCRLGRSNLPPDMQNNRTLIIKQQVSSYYFQDYRVLNFSNKGNYFSPRVDQYAPLTQNNIHVSGKMETNPLQFIIPFIIYDLKKSFKTSFKFFLGNN